MTTEGPTPPLLPDQSGEDPKPFYKRWWFIVIAVIFGLGLIGNLGGADTASNPEAVGTTTTSEPAPTTTSTAGATTTTAPTTTTSESAPTTTLANGSESNSPDVDVSPEDLPESVTSELFLFLIREESADLPWDWTDQWTDDDLQGFAQTICDGWDDGLTFEALGLAGISALMDEGWDTDTDFEMLGYVIGVATEAYCPEHSHKID